MALITIHKVYRNNKELFEYRSMIPSAPVPPTETARPRPIWRSSFCGASTHHSPHLRIARARAGPVIGCCDWAGDMIVPDATRAFGLGNSRSF